MTFWQVIQSHYTAIGFVTLLMFKTAVNALPAKGDPFQFGQWLMEWMRELGQQAPSKLPALPPAQAKILGDAGVPMTLAPPNSASQPPAPSVKP
jgi:hypothetical protein